MHKLKWPVSSKTVIVSSTTNVGVILESLTIECESTKEYCALGSRHMLH